MSTYGWTQEYVLWELSFQQFFLWYDRAMWGTKGQDMPEYDAKPIEEESSSFKQEIQDIRDGFVKVGNEWLATETYERMMKDK